VAALETNPVTYEPLPYKELLRQQRNVFNQTEKYLTETLPLIASPTQSIVLWKQDGYDTLISKACQLIHSAHSFILISFWQSESGDIETALRSAETRGVKVITIQYGPEYLAIGKVFRHIINDLILDRHKGTLTLVADDQAGLFMGQTPGRDWSGFWTTHPGISRLIANYIRHDIFSCKLLQRLGKIMGEDALTAELPRILDLLED
jgi:sugar-specific transcriptional regulator TrmB